jgi:hypothetical protein
MRTTLTLLLAMTIIASPAAQDPSLRDVVARAVAYVVDYQRQLSSVIADEEYHQEIRAQSPPDRRSPRSRQISGEVFFMFADGLWMTIRDPLTVDGQPARRQQSLREALRGEDLSALTRDYLFQNSRWNIGRTIRNFNEPTLALQVVDPHQVKRFKFTRESADRIAFKEKERPTLIQQVDGGPVYSEGHLVLEPQTGRIRRTEFRANVKGVRVTLTTDYVVDAKLGIAVPSVFHETYLRGKPGKDDHEHIACQAIYSNYRRFDVLTRIK